MTDLHETFTVADRLAPPTAEEAATCRECGNPLTVGGLAKGERFCSAACAAGEVVAS